MISNRRRAHRLVFSGLALFLPAMLVAALALRPSVPEPGSDFALLRAEARFASPGAEIPRATKDGAYAFDAFIQRRDQDRTALVLRPVVPILEPDLLVYWASGEEETNALPSDAVLLGSLAGTAGRSLSLPDAAANGRGRALVYSLGYQKVVSQFPLATVSGAEAQ